MTTEPDRIPAPVQITTVVQDGLAQLYLQFQGLPNIAGILTPWLAQAQELEDAFWALLSMTLATSYGTWVDVYGRILGQARYGLSDSAYIAVLQAVILANKSSGTIPEIEAITALLLGATGGTPPYTLTEWFPAAMVIEPAEPIGIDATNFVAILVLRKARAGGVRLLLVEPSASGGAVTCAPGRVPVRDTGEGWSDVTTDTGGYLVWIVE